MNAVYSFLLVRCFVLSLVLGFPLQISTPQQITTTNYEKQIIGECKFVEEVGFIIEPDAAVVQELQHLSQTKGYTQSISAPTWCQYSQLLYWWCSIGRDEFPSPFPDIVLPVQRSHNLNESECFFLSGVSSWY